MKLIEGVVVAHLDDGWVVFNGEKEELLEFNEVGGLVLWLIQEGVEEVDEITKAVVEKFDVDYAQAKLDINNFLEEMKAEGLLQ